MCRPYLARGFKTLLSARLKGTAEATEDDIAALLSKLLGAITDDMYKMPTTSTSSKFQDADHTAKALVSATPFRTELHTSLMCSLIRTHSAQIVDAQQVRMA